MMNLFTRAFHVFIVAAGIVLPIAPGAREQQGDTVPAVCSPQCTTSTNDTRDSLLTILGQLKKEADTVKKYFDEMKKPDQYVLFGDTAQHYHFESIGIKTMHFTNTDGYMVAVAGGGQPWNWFQIGFMVNYMWNTTINDTTISSPALANGTYRLFYGGICGEVDLFNNFNRLLPFPLHPIAGADLGFGTLNNVGDSYHTALCLDPYIGASMRLLTFLKIKGGVGWPLHNYSNRRCIKLSEQDGPTFRFFFETGNFNGRQ